MWKDPGRGGWVGLESDYDLFPIPSELALPKADIDMYVAALWSRLCFLRCITADPSP